MRSPLFDFCFYLVVCISFVAFCAWGIPYVLTPQATKWEMFCVGFLTALFTTQIVIPLLVMLWKKAREAK